MRRAVEYECFYPDIRLSKNHDKTERESIFSTKSGIEEILDNPQEEMEIDCLRIILTNLFIVFDYLFLQNPQR